MHYPAAGPLGRPLINHSPPALTESQTTPTTSGSPLPTRKTGTELLQVGLGGPGEPNLSFPITATSELSRDVPTASPEKNEEMKEAECSEN